MDLNVKVNDKVIFGRPNGEKTVATIIKINKSRLKVRQEEVRGSRPVGTIWSTPPELCTTLDGKSISNSVKSAPAKSNEMPSDWWIKTNKNEIRVLFDLYMQLSPENISCDGEAPMSHVRYMTSLLNRKLKAMFVVLERELDEDMVYRCMEILDKVEKPNGN